MSSLLQDLQILTIGKVITSLSVCIHILCVLDSHSYYMSHQNIGKFMYLDGNGWYNHFIKKYTDKCALVDGSTLTTQLMLP